jgi:hypothetical protein
MMRWERFLRLMTVLLFAATVMVGFQVQWAEARGFRGGAHGGGGAVQPAPRPGWSAPAYGSYPQYRGSSSYSYPNSYQYFFLGLGLGLVGAPYAYSAYSQPYRSYPAYPYAPYPAYYGACYAYDAYGRCLGYAPAGGYYYPY